jgi:hypothetical protein
MRALDRHQFRRVELSALVVFGAIAMPACDRRPPPLRPPVPLKTPGWAGGEVLLLRAGRPGQADLLLRRIRSEAAFGSGGGLSGNPAPFADGRPTYGYTCGAAALQELAPDAWDAVGSASHNCDEPSVRSPTASQPGPFEFDTRGHTLTYRKQPVAAAGKHVLRVVPSCSLRYVAVLSADGRIDEGLSFLGGRGPHSAGTHYHQVFSTANGRPLGTSVPLPWTTRQQQGLTPRWSPDERFIVYADSDGAEVLIIETNPGEGDQG